MGDIFKHRDGRTQWAAAASPLHRVLSEDPAWTLRAASDRTEPVHVTADEPPLKTWTRRQLNELAGELGIPQPEKLPNKDLLIQRIEAAHARD